MHDPTAEPVPNGERLVDAELVVATFNIRYGLAFDGRNSWWLRRRTTATAVAALGADVIAMQEVYAFQRRYLERQVGGYRAVGRGRNARDSGERCPIVVRHTVEVTSHVTRWFSDDPDRPGTKLPGATFPRIATIARCRHLASGRPFEAVSLHLDEHLEANRARSTEMLLHWLDPALPALVMGDYNAVEEDTAVFAPLEHAGFSFAPFDRGTSHQFLGHTNGPRIDHVLLRSTPSDRWQVLSADIPCHRSGRILPSDHWPARATVRLTSPSPANPAELGGGR